MYLNTNLNKERKYNIYKNIFTLSIPITINPYASITSNYVNLSGYKNNTLYIFFSGTSINYEIYINNMIGYYNLSNQLYTLPLLSGNDEYVCIAFGGNATLYTGYVFNQVSISIKNIGSDIIYLNEFNLISQV